MLSVYAFDTVKRLRLVNVRMRVHALLRVIMYCEYVLRNLVDPVTVVLSDDYR